MQEEIENRSVTLIISGAKLTGRVLKATIAKYLAHRKEKKSAKARAGPVIPHGRQTVEQSEPLANKVVAGKPKPEEEKSPLSELIEKINDKFGTEFTNIDKVLEQIVSDMDTNEELRTQAMNNSQEHFRFPFNDAFMDVVIGRMAQNQKFCERVLDDEKFGATVRDLLAGVVYDRLRNTPSSIA